MILSLLIFFLVLTVPPFFFSIRFGKRFEETVAISGGIIILILFFFGILDCLEVGVYAVLGITIILPAIASYFYMLSKKTKWMKHVGFSTVSDDLGGRFRSSVRENFFTPAFFAFCLVFLFLVFIHYGRLIHEWDEFSHWGRVVKSMTYANALSTSPKVHVGFKSYVPGMALFQYLFQKIMMLFPEGKFADWGLYFCYHLLAVIFLLPFFKLAKQKNCVSAFLLFICIAIIPCFLQDGYLTSIYIDSFVGLLAGIGFALLFVKERTKMTTADFLVICSMLVLSKDVGLFFAIMLGITRVILEIKEKGRWKRNAVVFGLIISAVAIPKLLWEWNIRINHVEATFRTPIDFRKLFRVLTFQEHGYLFDILKNYFGALASRTICLGGGTGITIGYPLLSILLFVLLSCCRIIYSKIRPDRKWASTVICIMIIATFIVYLLGLPVIYMFRFDQYEAVRLASLDRYLSIVFDCFIVAVFLIFFKYIQETGNIKHGLGIGLIVTCVLVNPYTLYRWLNRASVTDSIAYREKYTPVINSLLSLTGENEKKVWIISQASNGEDSLVISYGIMPCYVAGNGYSLAAKKDKLYDGDIWTRKISTEEWREELADKGIDYVLIYSVNKTFKEDYATLFQEPEDIGPERIFVVNHETCMLERVV